MTTTPIFGHLLDFAEHDVHISGSDHLAIHDATVFAQLGEVFVVNFIATAWWFSEDSKPLECSFCFWCHYQLEVGEDSKGEAGGG